MSNVNPKTETDTRRREFNKEKNNNWPFISGSRVTSDNFKPRALLIIIVRLDWVSGD